MNRQMPSGDRYTDAPPDIAEEIRASVAIEDDFPSPDELRRELKRSVTIRLDPDVYAWFQLPGPGYQTRINAVLRSYMQRWKADKATAQPVFLAEHHPTFLSAAKRPVKVAAKKAVKKTSKAVARKPAKKSSFVERMKARAKAKKGRKAPA